MDKDLLLFILKIEKLDYALFDSALRLVEWSADLEAFLPPQTTLARQTHVSALFPELSGCEDILLEIQKGDQDPFILDRIEKPVSHPEDAYRPEHLTDYYSLRAYPYNGQLLILLCDVSEEGSLEQRITQRRNELDLLNLQLIEDLKNANEELTQAYAKTLEGWAKALELRDVETEGHSQRVVDLTIQLAELMGVDKEDQLYYGYGALLHDVGKMGIPDSILKKPSSLSEEEWMIMRQHPMYAFNLLVPIKYLQKSLDIPRYHHEKWNGSGTPEGLKGEEIPLSARIFAIVDVFDALTSDRPYRCAWTKEEALKYIRDQRGQHFDPQVVDCFLSII